MTNEQINIAIAEACGWAHPSVQPYAFPDYCNDLNAMHEAEKVLPRQLYHVDYWQTGYGRFQTIVSEMTVTPFSATARQRAEAFLKTIGKWEEQ